jgi:hypothetical protein
MSFLVSISSPANHHPPTHPPTTKKKGGGERKERNREKKKKKKEKVYARVATQVDLLKLIDVVRARVGMQPGSAANRTQVFKGALGTTRKEGNIKEGKQTEATILKQKRS